MEVIRVIQQESHHVVGKICDRCHLRATTDDLWELEEFVSVKIDAGPGTTVFKDGDLLQADFCQACAKDVLGPYLRLVFSFADRRKVMEKIFGPPTP